MDDIRGLKSVQKEEKEKIPSNTNKVEDIFIIWNKCFMKYFFDIAKEMWMSQWEEAVASKIHLERVTDPDHRIIVLRVFINPLTGQSIQMNIRGETKSIPKKV